MLTLTPLLSVSVTLTSELYGTLTFEESNDEIALTLIPFWVGPPGPQGPQGIQGPPGDASVTALSITTALGYTPADAATVAGIETLLAAL